MSEKYAIDTDLKELAKMGDALVNYIHGDELYSNLSGGMFGGGNMPKLTLGAFLLRLRRLSTFRANLNAGQLATLEKAQTQYNEVRKEWTVHYEQKAVKESKSRLDAMTSFFNECRESPQSCAYGYKPEALRRTIVQELLMEMNKLGINNKEVTTKAQVVDGELRGWLYPADFLWDSKLESVYPADTFWWLYQLPAKE